MVHRSAREGYKQGAEIYQTARPAYHPALIDRFVDRYGRGLVADVGAGTGIFTSQLVAAGVQVVAVEPVEAMRAQLVERIPEVLALEGNAAEIPLDTAGVDTVVAAQAFHWFELPQSLDEIFRVMEPGGFLVTVWNVRDDSVGWADAYTDIQERYAGDAPRHSSMEWRTAIDADPRFGAADDWHIANPVPTTVEGVVRRALSTSFIAALPEAEQERVAREVEELVKPYGPTLDFPYRSELQAWRRA